MELEIQLNLEFDKSKRRYRIAVEMKTQYAKIFSTKLRDLWL